MRSFLVRAALVVALAALLTTPLVLHFSLARHDHLPFDVKAAYPPDEPIAPGEVFANTLIALMEHELDSGTGWRPNDFFLWGPTLWADNKSNRQLGIIQALRESTRVFRDNLTKVSATEYDPRLVDADTKFRNDERKFWFPAAETRFREGVQSLRAYVRGLKSEPRTSKPLNRRNVELIRLFTAWTDLLGSAHANLFKHFEVDEKKEKQGTVPVWKTDDYFYHAQGFAHVMYHLTLAVRREYEAELQDRQTVLELLDQVASSLGQAATLKPLVVLDGSPDGLFANHRRNLDAFLVNARQLMYSIREELEK
jgi:hypothetical protein